MVFAIGTKVRLKHTGDVGKVTGMLEHGMVNVLLEEDDMELPVAEEFLERYEVASKTKARIVQGKKDKTPQAPTSPEIALQYAILKSQGIQLAFDPIFKKDGTTERYDVYLLNATSKDIIYTFEINFLQSIPLKKNGQLKQFTALKIGDILFDALNDAPIVELEAWEMTTEGTGPRQHKELKIKAKQFFKKTVTAPFLNRPVHLYKLIETFDSLRAKDKPKEEDLLTYTERNAVPYKAKRKANHIYSHQADVNEFANFPIEIDLHLEKLTDSRTKRSNSEKLRLQLSHFSDYIDKAVRLGVERVFIIHGVGEGKLRNEITSRLIQNSHVKSFKNEYHPRYGFGATEVLF